MAFGDLRTSSTISPPLRERWEAVHAAWCEQWETLLRLTYGLDAPELFTERAFVGQWATAMTAAFPSTGLGVVERPVPKPTASGNGLLDLWLGVEDLTPIFEYAIEAKPVVIKHLNANKAATNCHRVASDELTAARAVAGGNFSKYPTGAAVGVVSRHQRFSTPTSTELDTFEANLWTEIQTLVHATVPTAPEVVMATHPFPAGEFAVWDSRVPLGAFALFLFTPD